MRLNRVLVAWKFLDFHNELAFRQSSHSYRRNVDVLEILHKHGYVVLYRYKILKVSQQCREEMQVRLGEG